MRMLDISPWSSDCRGRRDLQHDSRRGDGASVSVEMFYCNFYTASPRPPSPGVSPPPAWPPSASPWGSWSPSPPSGCGFLCCAGRGRFSWGTPGRTEYKNVTDSSRDARRVSSDRTCSGKFSYISCRSRLHFLALKAHSVPAVSAVVRQLDPTSSSGGLQGMELP